MLAAGTLVGEYVIERVLGEGGMAVVYEARQPSLHRQVALKLIGPKLAEDPSFRGRFQREAFAQAAIEHPNIVPVYGTGDSKAGPYLAMQLVRGPTLHDLIHVHALAPARALELLVPIADAIDAAHAAGLIHRDVKPRNVLVSTDWHPFLADFGITKAPGGTGVTNGDGFVGSAAYAAPEQITGEPTPSSDIYALGVTLFECLTHRTPFPAVDRAETLRAHLHAPPPAPSSLRPELPVALDDVLARALAKAPSDRPPTAAALLNAALSALDGGTFVTSDAPVPSGRPVGRGGERAERSMLLHRAEQSSSAFLDQTLGTGFHVMVPLELVPELTQRPRDRILPTARAREHLSPGATVTEVFDRHGGVQGDGLLVLGAPGAGKTTAVVELADELARRAQADPTAPVPVYLPLSSWGASRKPFRDWVVSQIHRLYKVSPAATRRAIDNDTPCVVLLLDGLDEIADHQARAACVNAVNAFAADYPLPIVVTARQTEYETLPVRLELETAVLVKPLEPSTVLARLREDPETAGVATVVDRDATLQDLLTSPLLVSMLTIAYRDRAPEDIPAAVETDRLIDDFLDRRFEMERIRSGGAPYPLDRTRHWLAELAAGLTARQQTIFVLERMRPDILRSADARRLVGIAPKIAYGFLAGVIVACAAWQLSKMLEKPEQPFAHVVMWSAWGVIAGLTQDWRTRARLPVWLVLGVVSGVSFRWLIGDDDAAGLLYQSLYLTAFFGLVGELIIRLVPADLPPAERLTWSWEHARPYILPGLLVGITLGPVFGVFFGLSLRSQDADVGSITYWAFMFGPLFGLLWAFCRGVGRGLLPARRSARTRPNEGIRQSAGYALMIGLVTLAVVQLVTVVGYLLWTLLGGESNELGMVALLSLAWGAGAGTLLGMACGGGAVVQHWTIRLLLWRAGVAPRNLTHWLAFVVRLRVLYWGVGGGHMFIHRVVQEHFAERHGNVER